MAEYHVGCGLAGIYAGTVNKGGETWRNKSNVTDEALAAVATYLKEEAAAAKQPESEWYGYKWKMPDGRALHLGVRITGEKTNDK